MTVLMREHAKYLSPHFSLVEMTDTAHRQYTNTPTEREVEHLRSLCLKLLEPIRTMVGPIRVSSGYRCPLLNKAVDGRPNSQHVQGLACDFVPIQMGLREATKKIIAEQRTDIIIHLPIDQLIYEYGRWIHVSIAPPMRIARKEMLMIGEWTEGKTVKLDLSKIPDAHA